MIFLIDEKRQREGEGAVCKRLKYLSNRNWIYCFNVQHVSESLLVLENKLFQDDIDVKVTSEEVDNAES